ncbi:MAG: carboxylating nicotinate-nucleotide diphosphorylase [Deltaproteobacteria bacterium]|nr:carboxylating nicotinate-nucleotide diphosphorylase [Deltaproteobacteria bacterium]
MKKEAAPSPEFREYVDMLIRASLAEDVGKTDVTTRAIAGKGSLGKAVIIAKEDCVLAGLFVAGRVFRTIDKTVKFDAVAVDGEAVKKGGTIATVSGSLATLLTGERVALNFLQRLSGIATLTNRFVKKAAGRAKIVDTRKTTPCLRALERYAVKAGGGENHRMGLYDAVIIKDNHIKAAGSVAEALSRVRKNYKGDGFVEVEATSLGELKEALAQPPDVIMLDNMDVKTIRKAVALIAGRAAVEVSGGVTLDTVSAIADSGVDRISVGAITHSAPSVDLSMEVVKAWTRKKARNRA